MCLNDANLEQHRQDRRNANSFTEAEQAECDGPEPCDEAADMEMFDE